MTAKPSQVIGNAPGRGFTQIQALRGWSSLAVVLFHIGAAVSAAKYFGVTWPGYVTHFGTNGVIVFFVLSGFIIHHVHAGEFGQPQRFSRYVMKRTLRLYPSFWVMLFLVWALILVTGIGSAPSGSETSVILKTIFLLPQDRMVVGGTGAPVIVVAWSLQYEILFYLAVGCFILNVRLGYFVTIAFVATYFAFVLTDNAHRFPAFLEMHYFGLFLLGVFASMASKRLRIGGHMETWMILGAYGTSALLWGADIVTGVRAARSGVGFPVTETNAAQLFIGLLVAVLLVGIVSRERRLGSAAPRPLQILGDWSYALYLVHYPVVSVVAKSVQAKGMTGDAAAAVTAVVSVIASLFLAAALHRLIERPFMNFARRPTRSPRP